MPSLTNTSGKKIAPAHLYRDANNVEVIYAVNFDGTLSLQFHYPAAGTYVGIETVTSFFTNTSESTSMMYRSLKVHYKAPRTRQGEALVRGEEVRPLPHNEVENIVEPSEVADESILTYVSENIPEPPRVAPLKPYEPDF